MISKRVFVLAALLLCVAGAASAEPGLVAGVLQMPLDGSGNPAGALNLTNNDAIITGVSTSVPATPTTWTPVSDPSVAVYNFTIAGANGGAWNGMGIRSSVCAANSTLSLAPTSVADYKAAGYTTLLGHDITALPNNAAIVVTTYAGDANLDGLVTPDDYGPIDLAVYDFNNNLPMPTSSWVNGDVNLDGAVTPDDYAAIDLAVYNFNNSIPYAPADTQLSFASAGGIIAVPEPSTLVLGFMVIAGFLGFRKFWN
jgi:hypothetical protein